MARYFMHLRDGTEQVLGPPGSRVSVRDLMKGDVEQGLLDFRFRIDAEDADGVIIYSLPFKLAVKIVPDTAPSA